MAFTSKILIGNLHMKCLIKTCHQQQQQTEKVEIPKETWPVGRPRQSVTEVLIKSTARTLGSQVVQIVRGILGSIFSKR